MTAASCAPATTPCLVVFLKAPPRAKRRLAAEIGQAATTAASHLLACALEDADAWHGPTVLAPATAADADWLARHRDRGDDLVVQQGESLGTRINYVDRVLRARGFDRLIFIGADCPSLDRPYLIDAAAALEQADAVLGPAADGGVVLMAARRPWPDIAALAWSTPALRDALVARLKAERWSLATLATLADVDRPDDLVTVATTLAGDPRPARRAFAAWLAARRSSRDAVA